MRIVVEPCGPARQWLGTEAVELNVAAPVSVADVADALASRFAEFAPRRNRCAFALADEIVPAAYHLADGAVLSVIPPVSGG